MAFRAKNSNNLLYFTSVYTAVATATLIAAAHRRTGWGL